MADFRMLILVNSNGAEMGKRTRENHIYLSVMLITHAHSKAGRTYVYTAVKPRSRFIDEPYKGHGIQVHGEQQYKNKNLQ